MCMYTLLSLQRDDHELRFLGSTLWPDWNSRCAVPQHGVWLTGSVDRLYQRSEGAWRTKTRAACCAGHAE